ncbi:unnamed protein product [Ambrosiozyma monospora]|uniref:Unnamed protein product n=1 Tax=Ambrosiozyma monospora TaxID=43982 RepID=A0ACB5UCX1_AMBMO|nr:unnamed protein product [Ambrosiozyma monospora]
MEEEQSTHPTSTITNDDPFQNPKQTEYQDPLAKRKSSLLPPNIDQSTLSLFEKLHHDIPQIQDYLSLQSSSPADTTGTARPILTSTPSTSSTDGPKATRTYSHSLLLPATDTGAPPPHLPPATAPSQQRISRVKSLIDELPNNSKLRTATNAAGDSPLLNRSVSNGGSTSLNEPVLQQMEVVAI